MIDWLAALGRIGLEFSAGLVAPTCWRWRCWVACPSCCGGAPAARAIAVGRRVDGVGSLPSPVFCPVWCWVCWGHYILSRFGAEATLGVTSPHRWCVNSVQWSRAVVCRAAGSALAAEIGLMKATEQLPDSR